MIQQTMKLTALLCVGLFRLAGAQTLDTLLDVGGHRLHFTVTPGTGTPILFEAGNGDDGSVWQPILGAVHDATHAPVITYDRAGLGRSELDTTAVGIVNEVQALEGALKQLGYSQKVFLVCHSFGGYYAALFAYRNRAKVQGVVCIDVATPCFFSQAWSENFLKSIKAEEWEMIKHYKPGLYYALTYFTATSGYMADKFLTSRTPVTVIRAENIQPMVKASEQEKWIACSQAFGTMPHHHYVLAKNADHKVWDKNPQVVIDEVARLYHKVGPH